MRKFNLTLIASCAMLLFCAGPAAAQLRIVSYNTANAFDTSPRTGMDLVLEAIGNEPINGIAKPIDILLLQEQDEPYTSTLQFVNLLNGIYGAGTYSRGTLPTLPSNSSMRQTIVYNTTTTTLLEEMNIGSDDVGSGTNEQPRSAMRYKVGIVGYDSSADFYLYNSHYKAADDAVSMNRRNVEATNIREDVDALGEGTHAIFAGDYNIQSSTEQSYQTLLAAGPGQAFDPINTPGNWNLSFPLRLTHTQSPHDGSVNGLIEGGMNDRFDFQLVTGEFLDDEGLSYISGSYHTFGNNGTTYNRRINDPANTYVFEPGQSEMDRVAILDALAHVSDHAPLIADYQVPAKMGVDVTMPSEVYLNSTTGLTVTVENTADVVAAIGADELEYTLTTSGDLTGMATDTDLALGGGNMHAVTLDTTTLGMHAGNIMVNSSSPQAANSMVSIPVNYNVIYIPGDFDLDGNVDLDDYDILSGHYGMAGGLTDGDADGSGIVGFEDFTIMALHFGISVSESLTVPEPGSLALLGLGVAALGWRRRGLV